MPLIKDGRSVPDPWIALGDGDAVPASGPVIVSLARFHADSGALRDRADPLGVRMTSAEHAHEIGEHATSLAVIALEFPAFKDGRAYSTARLLRERYGFAGELRAVGNVLRDQFLFMQRCGFDAFEVADERAVAAWTEATQAFSVFYQPASDARLSASRLRSQERGGR
ncbi:MAG: DUF934 domain-containing protein [Rhodospirillales bacterium]|nr:DUF934 domain-containing protein [Rhodospirillales bacterium]